MFANIRFLITSAAVLAVLSIGGWLWVSNNNLKSENDLLVANSAILSTALDESKQSFDLLKGEYDKIRAAYQLAVREFSAIDKNAASAIKKIESADLANNLEIDVNKLFNEVSRCLEIASGSPLTKEELEKENAEDFNSQCPWAFPVGSVQ